MPLLDMVYQVVYGAPPPTPIQPPTIIVPVLGVLAVGIGVLVLIFNKRIRAVIKKIL